MERRSFLQWLGIGTAAAVGGVVKKKAEAIESTIPTPAPVVEDKPTKLEFLNPISHTGELDPASDQFPIWHKYGSGNIADGFDCVGWSTSPKSGLISFGYNDDIVTLVNNSNSLISAGDPLFCNIHGYVTTNVDDQFIGYAMSGPDLDGYIKVLLRNESEKPECTKTTPTHISVSG